MSVLGKTVVFRYVNAAGVESDRLVVIFRFNETLLSGLCLESQVYKTFRFDRIVGDIYYDSTSEKLTARDFPEYERAAPCKSPHPSTVRIPKRPEKIEVLFTGFTKNRRSELEELAVEFDMRVCKTVTNGLHYLVCGYNAGPKKMADAQAKGVMLMFEDQFLMLLETGELPA